MTSIANCSIGLLFCDESSQAEKALIWGKPIKLVCTLDCCQGFLRINSNRGIAQQGRNIDNVQKKSEGIIGLLQYLRTTVKITMRVQKVNPHFLLVGGSGTNS
jgi:hypothetical protein